MSRNSSVAVLADRTHLDNSHASLIGVNGPPSILNIEDETILSNNTDISTSQVIGSVSFLERVQSTDLAALFPRGSLNHIHKKKKKKKGSESSQSNCSQSSENVSSLQSNINETASDSFEECSENREEPPKPFNKRLYLRRKSVKLSFGPGSLNNSVSEKSLRRRSSRVVNVSFDPLGSEGSNVTAETDENASDLESSKKLGIEDKSAKVFIKRSNRKKKSVNINFDSDSLNNSGTEKSLESSQILDVSLPSKKKNASRKKKFIPALNIDELEFSGENSLTKKTISTPSCDNISSIDEEINESKPDSAKGVSENMHKDKRTDDSFNAIDKQSTKVFKKDLYLRKKSINISLDSSSLNESSVKKSLEENNRVENGSTFEVSRKMETEEELSEANNSVVVSLNDQSAKKSLEGNNQADNVSSDQSSPKTTNNIESADTASTSFDVSSKINNEEESILLFNKKSYLRQKSIKISFDSSSLNASSMVEKNLEKDGEVVDFSLKPSSSEITNVTDYPENTLNDLPNENNTAAISPKIGGENNISTTENDSLSNISTSDASKAIENEIKLAILIPSSNNVSCSQINDEFKESLTIPSEENKIVEDNHLSITDSSSKFPDQRSHIIINPKSIDLQKNEEIVLSYENNAGGIIDGEKNLSTAESDLLTNESLKDVEKFAGVFNKKSYLRKKSINVSFESSSLNADLTKNLLEKNSQVIDVFSKALSPKITNQVTESAENVSTFEVSHIMENEDTSPKVFNKNRYLKKKSMHISFDSSSLNDSTVDERDKINSQVVDVSSRTLSPKSTNVTESAENVSSLEVSQNIENDETSPKVFNKNRYLKKKSMVISFDSSSLNDSMVDKRDKINSQVVDVSSRTLSPKSTNVTESAENVSSLEVSQNIENDETSPKVFNKNRYLKKKSMVISFDSSSLNDSTVDKGAKMNNQVVDTSSKPLSPKIRNSTESAEIVLTSFDVSSKINTEEESIKVLNKKSYLRQKSIKISFDSSSFNDHNIENNLEKNAEESSEGNNSADVSLNDQGAKISLDRNNQVDCDLSDPSSPKMTNNTESADTVSTSLDVSSKINNEEESIKVLNKKSYLRQKSIKISFDSSSFNNHTIENNLDKNEGESSEGNNSANVSLNNQGAKKSLDGNNQVDCDLSDPSSPKMTNNTESADTVSTSFHLSSKINNEEESIKVLNMKSYLRQKSIKISFDSSSFNDHTTENNLDKNGEESSEGNNSADVSLNDQGAKKSLDGNNQVDCDLSDPSSPQMTNNTEGVSENMHKDKRTDDSFNAIDKQSAKVFKKDLYLRKKSIKISFDSSSINGSMVDKGVEKYSQVIDICSESAQNVSVSSEACKKIEKGSDDSIIKDDHSSITDCNAYLTDHGSKSHVKYKVSNIEQNDEAVVPQNGNTELTNVPNIKDPINDCVTDSRVIGKQKNTSTLQSDLHTNISTKDSWKAIDEESAKIIDKNMYLKAPINGSFDSNSLNDSKMSSTIKNATETFKNVSEALIVIQDSNIVTNGVSNGDENTSNTATCNTSKVDNVAINNEEKHLPAEEDGKLSNILPSEIVEEKEIELDSERNSSPKMAKSIPSTISMSADESLPNNTSNHSQAITDNNSNITDNSVHLLGNGSNPHVANEVEQNEEIVLSKYRNTEEIDAHNSASDHHNENVYKSAINNSNIVDEEKNELKTENNEHLMILSNDPSIAIEGSVSKDGSKGNLKSISTSISIPCTQMDEKANESRDMSIANKHSPIVENNEHCLGDHKLILHLNLESSDPEHNDEAIVPSECFSSTSKKDNRNSLLENKNSELMDVKDISKGSVAKTNSSPNDNFASFSEVKNKTASENDMLKVREKRPVEEDCKVEDYRRKRARSIPSFNNSSCNQINERSTESQSIPSEENSLKEGTSEDNKSIKAGVSNANITSVASDLQQIEEAGLSKSVKAGTSRSSYKKENRNSIKKNKKDKHVELIDAKNNDGSDLSDAKSNVRNFSNIDKDDIVGENYRHADILINDPSKVIGDGSIVQNNPEENHPSSEKIQSTSASLNIPCSEKDEEFNESHMKLTEESDSNSNSSKENNSKRRKGRSMKKNIDMRMSVGLSVICKDNERIPGTDSVKNICHSTPLVKYQKNKIIGKETEEVDSDSKHVFACPDIPARNLRERSINNKSLSTKDTKNQSDNLENSAKKSKSPPSGNKSEDFIPDISIIPNPKPFTRSRVMYHSTPINKAFSKRSSSKIRVSSNIEIENENVQKQDKMIQISKSIFGSSSEVTNGTVSKKKSRELSDNSSPHSAISDNKTKRKSDSLHTGIKKLPKMESIAESRSYHSNFLSTFEDDSSYYTTRKSIKRVAFKSISLEANSTSSGYGHGSEYNASNRNRKSVGFRDALSLIEDTIGNSSEGDIRDANNSHSSIVNPNSIRVSNIQGTANDSKSIIDRNDLSLNYSAEVPEIILTENEIEGNEVFEECSLFNKLIEMAEKKKMGENAATRQGKLSRGRKRGSSNLVVSHGTSGLRQHEKWVSPNLIKFLHKKLMTDELDYVIKTERIISILCSAVSAVRNLEEADDIDSALIPLKNVLLKFSVCSNMIEYCTFISRFTPFEFQHKALPLEGYFGSIKRGVNKKLSDPILTETEKMSVFL